MSKPSLHEIANMPYPASLEAMRENYQHDWGKFVEDGATKASYEVAVTYMVEETEFVTVEAFSPAEAEEIASQKFEQHGDVVESIATLKESEQ